uniref:Protein POLLENLESS 3-LIKE 1-like n=1 Tax=Cucumis melo TaxID=3656 RepID=A0A9I9ELL5_CUCME
MWANNGKNNFPCKGFLTPPPSWKSRPFRSPRMAPFSERKRSSPNFANKSDIFHVIHKVPAGDSPYVKAKQVQRIWPFLLLQLIEKDPSRAVSLFWAAINAGDRVDSALKDMAVVMKQLDRSDEAIEAIKSFRHLCPYDSQESIDNVLIELYKRSGRIEEEIDMLQRKLKQIEDGTIFGGKRTKAARSQGKKVQITIEQEKARVLGNLAWAFLQLNNVYVAEDYYRKALSLEADNNKKCNLAICQILTNRLTEAKSLLQSVRASSGGKPMEESYAKSFERASHMLTEKESKSFNPTGNEEDNGTGTTITSKNTTGRAGHCVPQFAASTRWTHDDEQMYINENSRGNDPHWDCCDDKSIGAVNSSHNYLHSDKWIEGCCIDNLGKTVSSIPTKIKGNRNRDGLLRLVEESFNCCSLYTSPTPTKRNVEVPFTQPKNSFWEFNNRWRSKEGKQQQKRTRKVLFENPSRKDQTFDSGFVVDYSSESDELEPASNYKSKYRSAASNSIELEVPFTQPRSCSWGMNGGGNSRKTAEYFRSLLSSSSSRKLSFELPTTSTENTQAMTDSNLGRSKLSREISDEPQDLAGDCKRTSYGDIEYEEGTIPNDTMKIMEEHITDHKFKHNSPTVGGKKSWADMVEEEEEDSDDKNEDDTEETSSSSGRRQVNCFDDNWSSSSDNVEFKFNDENLTVHQEVEC